MFISYLKITSKYVACCLFLLLVILTTSCSNSHSSNNASVEKPTNDAPVTKQPLEPTPTPTDTNIVVSPTPSADPTDPVDPIEPVDQLLATLDTKQKVGQLLMFGIEGKSINKQILEQLQTYQLGGIILYKRNIASVKQTNQLLNELKDQQDAKQALPLWLGVDQEGGKVSRLPKQLTALPTPALVNDHMDDNPQYATNFGQAIGLQLQSLGFNLTFAPVLDINSNPDNPVIGSRAYGTTPTQVINNGIAAMNGIQSQQIATSVKHFPGHGDTSVDSHLDLPMIEKSLNELESFELKPFVAALEHDVDMVMIGHLLIPAIDETYPASMSTATISKLLREKLNYDGVVISDDMTMGGITEHWAIGKAAVQAVVAGTDIVLVGHDPKLQKEVAQAISDAVSDQTISPERLDESVRRILLLKEKYKLNNEQTPIPDIEEINKAVDELLQ